MPTLTCRWALVAALVISCLMPAAAQAGNQLENVATAVNEQDNTRVFDLAWNISMQKNDDDVSHHNEAFARAHCVQCKSTAIAFQIVIVSGSPARVYPQNVADAQNILCTECESVAEARQFVRVAPEPVRFTGAGRATLADVHQQLAEMEGQDLSPFEVHAKVEQQEARVLDVLRNELVSKNDPKADANVLERRSLQAASIG